MKKVIIGTKARRKQLAQRQKLDTVNQLRCTTCNELAIKTPDGKGNYTCKCPFCKTEFRFSLM